jgi:Mg-chelatase subunit ChlD
MKRLILNLSCCGALLLGCGSDPQKPETSGNVDNAGSDDDTGRDAGTKKPDAGTKDASGGGKKDASNGGGGNDGLCESKNISAKARPPDILIVLDRSLSMAATRWAPSVQAVTSLVSQYEDRIQFGLSMFPHGQFGLCDPGEIDVPIGPMNASAINGLIGMTQPFGVTPTAGSLRNALKSLGDREQAADSVSSEAFVMLVTDGEPSCPDDVSPDPIQGSIDAVKALKDANIKTYVIGYGVAMGAGTMTAMAQAGGTDDYYPVENKDQLDQAFKDITGDLVSCTFELDDVPQDPTFVRITIDGATVELEAADGWVIDGKKITLQGGSCDTLKDGTNHLLKANVECERVYL